MKKLPNGMHYEDRPDGVFICWPGHGGASIDLKRRCFTLGFDTGRFPNRQPGAYIGRGWKNALIDDALTALVSSWSVP